jgi:hypothetical protein
MKHETQTQIDVIALEREARRLRAEAVATFLRDLGARLRGRAPALSTKTASRTA